MDAIIWACVFAGCAAAWCNWISNLPADDEPGLGLGFGVFLQAILVGWFLRWRWMTVTRARSERTRLLCLCSICGYDLRATPGRCPECGTVPGQPVVSASSFFCPL